MSEFGINDILIGARQEAYRMRHFFVGVEHLFVALLQVRGSLTRSIVESLGFSPEYVVDAIRRKVGKGGKARLWAGVPTTPRAETVMNRADTLAQDSDNPDEIERALLLALFDEKHTLPLRVLAALGHMDADALTAMVRSHDLASDTRDTFVNVTYAPDYDMTFKLTSEQEFVIRRMFYAYAEARIERHLPGGFSDATLVVVTPFHADGRQDAPVVAKVSHVDDILDEARRYATYVKSKLPPMTARLEDKPVAPEQSDLAAIKYTLIADHDRIPRDLRAILDHWEASKIANWISTDLFPTFGHEWWRQNRPYRFQVWREYDWLLPPILTLDIAETAPSKAFTMRMPVKRAKLRRLDYGDTVIVENFVVQRVRPEDKTIQLAVGHGTDAARAYRIEVRGVDFENNTYYRGEVIDSLAGTIWNTRHQQLVNGVRALSPDFDPEADQIIIDSDFSIPNPIVAYEGLLDSYVNGSLSTIHGDFHPGNIMIGPNASAFLIDFAHARDGHTVFDWATLETSIISDHYLPDAQVTWSDLREFIRELHQFNGVVVQDHVDDQGDVYDVLAAIRDVAKHCLVTPENWSEYFVALAFCALRAALWETLEITGRRMALLLAGLAIHELRTRFHPSSGSQTPSPDDTEINTQP